MTAVALSPGVAALILFGAFFVLIVLRVLVAFALGLAYLPLLMFDTGCRRWCSSTRPSRPTTRSSCWRCRSFC